MNRTLAIPMAAATLVLAACGGGGSGGGDTAAPAPTEAVPASASQSVDGMWNYLKVLAGVAPDDKEPLDVSGFAPPKPDDAEPAAAQ